jgi:hypothetical protein
MKKKLFILSTILFLTGYQHVQSQIFEISANPHIDLFTFGSNDSLRDNNAVRTPLGGEIGVHFLLNRDWYFGVGLRLDHQSFGVTWTNPGLFDTIHPDIGVITDLSQTATKVVHASHRGFYAAVPLRLDYVIHREQGRDIGMGFSFGITPRFLVLRDELYILEAFTLHGERRHRLKDSGYEWSNFNVDIEAGYRFSFPATPSIRFLVEPGFRIPLLNATSEGFRSYSLYSKVGFRFEPNL